ncbi:MAG: hypothetical protein PVJ71_04030 [Lysobacterales bacterium]|jgi:hypothetical protein
MKFTPSLSFFLVALLGGAAVADDAVFKPFVVASSGPGALEEATAATVNALEAAGFEVVGQYSPFEGSNLVVATSDAMKRIAAQTERGGYGAAQRISVAENDGGIEVSFVNPLYIQHAYRMEADMQPVYDALVSTLGYSAECGGGDKEMTPRKLAKYNYMPTMQKFDDPSELGEFASHAEAVAAVENGLAVPGDALEQVYRIDIPGKEQAVFGVGMIMTSEDEEDLDSAFQMSIVDFEGCKKSAYFPYEVLVNGNEVEALHMRFRMAVHFPNLSMMGAHGFTKLISSPGAIEDALEAMVGSE